MVSPGLLFEVRSRLSYPDSSNKSQTPRDANLFQDLQWASIHQKPVEANRIAESTEIVEK